MKKCPHCAETIRDDAVICDHCGRDVRVPPGPSSPDRPSPGTGATGAPLKGAEVRDGSGDLEVDRPRREEEPRWPDPGRRQETPSGTAVGEGALRFSHSGYRYILGYGGDFFGIWDRETPGGPVRRFPRTDEGWGEAWNRFSALEPRAMEVSREGPGGGAVRATGVGFVSPTTRGRWTTTLLAALAALTAVLAAFRGNQLVLIRRIRAGAAVADAEAQAADDRVAVVASLILLVSVGVIVAWLLWQHRAHRNLRALGANDLRFSPGWAVGWWFVPFANLVMPFLAMRELWRASDPEAGAASWKMVPPTPLLAFWWGGFLLGGVVLPGMAATVQATGDGAGAIMAETSLLLASDVVSLLTAVMAIVLVRRINRRQAAKLERITEWSEGSPDPATRQSPRPMNETRRTSGPGRA